MEAKICCAYNLSRGCRIGSKVTVADCAGAPFKLMKLMLDTLAKDAEAGFWLTHLSQTPQIVRLFPFDFVYLDTDLKIVQAVELPPEAKLPRFHSRAASAIVLPLNALSASGTVEGDTLIICPEAELESRLAGVDHTAAVVNEAPAAVPQHAIHSGLSEALHLPLSAAATMPAVSPQISVPMPAISATQGSGHTYSVSSMWQISTSTPAGVLLDSVAEIELTGSSLAVADEALEESLDTNTAETENAKEPPVEAAEESLEPLPLNLSPAGFIAAEKQEQKPASIKIVEAETEGASESTEAANAPNQIPEILDTDLATVFDAAIAEEFGQEVLEPRPVEAKTADPVTSPEIEPVKASENAPAAKKEPDSGQVPAKVEPKATAPTEKKPAPARALQPAAAPKPGGPRQIPASPLQSTESRPASRGRKKSFGYLVKEFLNCPDPLPEMRAAPRLVQQGMVACEKTVDGSSAPMEVRDVSPAGLYLRTRKRWQPRKIFTLTLQKKGAGEDEFQSRVNVRVAAVRSDENGVGLAWVFSKKVKFDPWRRVHTKRSDETDIQFFIRELRLTRGLGFLEDICPLATEEIRHALQERFSNKRVASAVEIALKAEDLLIRQGSRTPVLAHSEIVMRVLENGSWIEDDWIRKMWAGLLVSSCCADGADKSNLAFLELMARLTPIHLRIFSFVCKRAADAIEAGQPEAKLDIYSTTKELMEAADSHSFQRIQQTIGHLCNFGLFQEVLRPSYSVVDERAKTRTTPTPTGLKMYAHCLGQRA